MSCASCGRANRDGARFCGGCGTSLAPRCPACGAESALDARFCDACGAALAAKPIEAAGARKVVTIVFADLVGSTALHERLDAESARPFMESYYRAMRGAVEAHGGTVAKLLGDGVMAVFGLPRVAEDDAIRAVRAAVEMQRAFRELAQQQSGAVGKTGLRIAVNTGEVVAKDATEIIGDPVNVAARLQEQGRDGDVVIGESTRQLVVGLVTLAPLGSVTLKGRSEAVTAYRVVSLERPASATTAAFVGRDDELARITAVYDAAIAAPAARLAVLLGSPGLGKSRLIDELTRRLGDAATVLTAQCDAAGGATFAPLAKALRERLQIDDGTSGDALRTALAAAVPGDDAEHARILDGIAALLAGSPASPEETFFVVRRLLAALAAVRPVVLVIDDLHWAEPLLLDLVEHLVQWGSGVRLLVLVGARPELRDTRSSLATPGGLVADVVTLAGLDAGAATRLAANMIGATDLPAAVAAKVLATSEGNPLFVGELVRMLVHEGALKQEGDRWIIGVGLAALEMPPTIHALLAARIERLRPEERSVLERAAIVGRHFSRSAVAALLPREVTDLDARLEALRRSELIEPDTGWFLGEPALRFHHVLIRDAAYRRVLKGTRAELHGRFADWIEARAPEAVEHDETIGWHLEQAHQHLRELGPLDAQGRTLGERAARHLAAAGRRALARDDLPLAASLLGRALDRLDAADPARADLALDWCEALLAAGDVGPAAGAITELDRFTADSDRLRAWHTCFAGQLTALTAPQELHATAEAVAAAADELAALGDAAGEAKAHAVHAQALARLGRVGACEAALDRALAAARRAGDRRRANAVLAGAPLAALWGPSPVTRASGRCLDVVRVLRITQGAPAVEAVALSCQGVLEALRGRTDAARRMIASSRKMVEELGITHRLLEADVFAARIELLEGDSVAAERLLRAAYEGLRDLGLGIDAAQAAALLARALLAQGRAVEAEALSHESEALAGDDLQAAIAWRGVRAEALAQRGEHAAAVEFAQAAVAIAAATDALLDHADARLALAAALRVAGRSSEADAEERRANELWEAKGATLLAERARRDGGRPDPVARMSEERSEPTRPIRRRVRVNAATANAAGLDAAVVARDADALLILFADELGIVDHTTGVDFDRQGALSSFRSLMNARDPTCLNEPLATLGESLALSRLSVSASGLAGGKVDIGAYEKQEIHLNEVDAQGRRRLGEVFATHHLGDAIARLYERYAEILPDGPARTRAAATAHSVAALAGALELDRVAPAFALDIEVADQRTVGFGALHGAESLLHAMRAMLELVEGIDWRIDEVFALSAGALLVRQTSFGVERVGGGTFERPICELYLFGPDGLVTRWERFDLQHTPDALARFDELTAEPMKVPPVRRHVRPNAASAMVLRLEAAFTARDADTLAALFSESMEHVDHPTGATYGRDGVLASVQRLHRSHDPRLRHELLATVGESLGLSRRWISASGTSGGRFDVGPYEREEIVIFETDERGRFRRVEVFAADHLGDAMARLYARYAELLPPGPACARAVATARSVAARMAPDFDRFTTGFASNVAFVDHRTLGLPSGQGADELVDRFRTLSELADDLSVRIPDVLRLDPCALLAHATMAGTVHASGGAFELDVLALFVFGADGLMTHYEIFDANRETEALARFEELTAAPAHARPTRRVRQNAASALAARFEAAFAAGDADAIAALWTDALEVIDHPNGATYGRDGHLASIRRLQRARDPKMRFEPLATLGASLCLTRRRIASKGTGGTRFDVGESEHEVFVLFEVGERGPCRRIEIFAVGHLNDAVIRSCERHAELLPDGPASERAAATARSVAILFGATAIGEVDRYAAALAPAIESIDHRTLGLPPGRGADETMRRIRALYDLAPDVILQVQDILGLESDVLLLRTLVSGTDRASGGAFEMPALSLFGFSPDGRVVCDELFDSEREVEALARFDEIVGSTDTAPVARFANAATRWLEQYERTWAVGDWDAIAASYPPTFHLDDRRSLTRLRISAEPYLAKLRMLFEVPKRQWRFTPVATRGERLALTQMLHEGDADNGGGALAIEFLAIAELGPDGRPVELVLFDLADLDAAYAELDARWDAGEAAAHPRVAAMLRALRLALASRDWDALTALCAPDLVLDDHRLLGWGTTLREPAAFVRSEQLLVDLAPDVGPHVHHLRVSDRGALFEAAVLGTRDGGAFEIPLIGVSELDEQGKLHRYDVYDIDRLDQALTRFDEIVGGAAAPSAPRFANTATRSFDVYVRSWHARDLAQPAAPRFENAAARVRNELVASWSGGDWQRLARVIPARFRYVDRARIAQLELDRDQWLAYTRPLREMGSMRGTQQILATRGNRLALARSQIEVAGGDVGPSEIVSLFLCEVDDQSELVEMVRFDGEDLDAAYAELDARYDAGEAVATTGAPAWLPEFARILARRDWDALAATFAPMLVAHDHRLVSWGTLEGPAEYSRALRALVDLAPDVRLRVHHLRTSAGGELFEAAWEGTRDGGPFEIPVVGVVELDAQRKQRRFDLYDADKLEQARARFAEIAASVLPNPLRIPPNAAT